MTIDRMIELCNEMKSKGHNYVNNSALGNFTFSKSDILNKGVTEKTLYIRVERENDLYYKNIPCYLMFVDIELNHHDEVEFKFFVKVNFKDFPKDFDISDHFDCVHDGIVGVDYEYLHNYDFDNSLAIQY